MRITELREGAMTSAPLQSLAQGSMFWSPDHVEMSAWLDHLPWIFWLVEAMAPQRCVTLGARVGSPHTAFCQGISRLNLDTECLLVADGEDEEADAIHAAADRRYGAVSRRLNVVPRRGSKQLVAGSVDILALDFAPTDPDLEDVLDRWLSRVSERGVILIPGINRREPGCSAFEHFEALQVTYRSLAFHHGDGLGVLIIGERSIDLLETLLERWSSSTAARTIRDVFARLGRGCTDQALSDLQRSHLNSVKQRVQELTEEREVHEEALEQFKLRFQKRDEHLAALESEKQALASLLEETRSERAGMAHQLAELQSRLISTESALQASGAQCRALEVDIEDKEASVQTRFQELAALTQVAEEKNQAFANLESALQVSEAQCRALEADIANKDTSLLVRFRELAILTQMAEEKDRSVEKLKLSIISLENQVSEYKRELTKVYASLVETEGNRDALEIENAKLEVRVDELQTKPKVLSDQREIGYWEHEFEELLQERDDNIAARFKELATLTQMLEERDRDIASLKSELQRGAVNEENSERRSFTSEATSPSSLSKTSSKWLLSPIKSGGKRKVHRKCQAAIAELEASAWFDAQWYLTQYPDIASDETYAQFPVLHYLKFGGFEGRDPSPYFGSAAYLEAYPDVAITEINPLLHFIRDGIKEGREPKP